MITHLETVGCKAQQTEGREQSLVSNSGAHKGGGGDGNRIIHSDYPRCCLDGCSVENVQRKYRLKANLNFAVIN